MKKTLLTGLSCVALIISAAHFLGTSKTNNGEVINASNVATPKLAKQKMSECGSVSAVGDSLYSESTKESTATNSTAINSQVFSEQSFVPEEVSKINFEDKEDTALSILDGKDFIFESGHFIHGAVQNRIHDEKDENKRNGFNDLFGGAEPIGDKKMIRGRIYIHPSSELSGTVLKEIDVDFFRFSINEERNYTFELSAPHPNYFYKIYRFGSNLRDDFMEDSLEKHHLLYSSRGSYESKHSMLLRTGTYFVAISCATKNGVRPDQTYTLSLSYDYKEDWFEEVQIDESLRTYYDVVTWESEDIPYNINRYSEEPVELARYYPYGQTYTKGFIDPAFLADGNAWNPYKSNCPEPDTSYKLDSITYLLNEKTIRAYKDNLKDAIRGFKAKKNNNFTDTKIDLVLGAAGYTLTVYGSFAGGPFSFIFSTAVATWSLGKAISAMIDFHADSEHALSGECIGSGLTSLYERAVDILTNQERAENKILAIPRYSYLYLDDVYYASTGELKLYKIGFTQNLPDLYPVDYFLFDKDGTISRTQYMYDYAASAEAEEVIWDYNKPVRGKIQIFEMLSDYTDYCEYYPTEDLDITEGASQPQGTYSICKTGSTYKLHVNNYTDNYLWVLCNNRSISDWQLENFNIYHKDGYSFYEIKKGKSVDIPMDGRSYIYVREGYDPFVTKIYYKDGMTLYDDPIFFGSEYLKLSVVSYSIMTSKWTIRVRNLSGHVACVKFNKKMCFTDHAKTWSSELSDWVETGYYLFPLETFDIEISENGTADAIAISYYYENDETRYISYANQLNKFTNTLSYRTSAVTY